MSADEWRPIESIVDRLDRAQRDVDLELIVGSSKELVEAVARLVLTARGEIVGSNVKVDQVLTRAHALLGRQPGPGLADDPEVRAVAQHARSLVAQVPTLRNRYGTGHGRPVAPDVREEHALIAVDAAGLWCRWAVRRLNHLIAGSPQALARDLKEGVVFYRDTLRDRLAAADLASLDVADQQLIGVAVGQRTVGKTFVVAEEGVEACAREPSLDVWPSGYRSGVVMGLFLDRNGHLDSTEFGARHAALVIAPDPDAERVIEELAQQAELADWAYGLASDVAKRTSIAEAMRSVAAVLPTERSRRLWESLAAQIGHVPG